MQHPNYHTFTKFTITIVILKEQKKGNKNKKSDSKSFCQKKFYIFAALKKIKR